MMTFGRFLFPASSYLLFNGHGNITNRSSVRLISRLNFSLFIWPISPLVINTAIIPPIPTNYSCNSGMLGSLSGQSLRGPSERLPPHTSGLPYREHASTRSNQIGLVKLPSAVGLERWMPSSSAFSSTCQHPSFNTFTT